MVVTGMLEMHIWDGFRRGRKRSDPDYDPKEQIDDEKLMHFVIGLRWGAGASVWFEFLRISTYDDVPRRPTTYQHYSFEEVVTDRFPGPWGARQT